LISARDDGIVVAMDWQVLQIHSGAQVAEPARLNALSHVLAGPQQAERPVHCRVRKSGVDALWREAPRR
jgi:hypothetical protein